MPGDGATLARRRPLLPPVYFLMAIAAMAALHILAPSGAWNYWPWNSLGLVPIAAGLVFALLGSRRFRCADTTLYPFETSTLLVTDGVFGYSRNPMYLGMMLVLVGTVTVLGSATPFLVLPLFFAVIRWRFIRHEERSLSRQFGAAYHEYTRRVRRWL